MSETPTDGLRAPSVYEDMDTEQLEQLLREDAQASGQALDPQDLMYITNILADRIKAPPPGPAWKNFQQNYLPDRTPAMDKFRKSALRWRQIAAVAAIVVLLFAIPAVSNAIEYGNICGYQATWDEELFWFQWHQGATPNLDAWDLSGVSVEDLQRAGCYPTWIPGGFERVKLRYREFEGAERIRVDYAKGSKGMIVLIKEVPPDTTGGMSANGETVQLYRYNGTDYYIYRNIDYLCVSWVSNGLECSISAEIAPWQLKKMIHSIVKE